MRFEARYLFELLVWCVEDEFGGAAVFFGQKTSKAKSGKLWSNESTAVMTHTTGLYGYLWETLINQYLQLLPVPE